MHDLLNWSLKTCVFKKMQICLSPIYTYRGRVELDPDVNNLKL